MSAGPVGVGLREAVGHVDLRRAGELVEPVLPGRAHHRAEVVVERRVVRRQHAQDRQVRLRRSSRSGSGRRPSPVLRKPSQRPSAYWVAMPCHVWSGSSYVAALEVGREGPRGVRRRRRRPRRLSPCWRPLAPGSQPSMWSNDRFSIISTTTVSNGASFGGGSEQTCTPFASAAQGSIAPPPHPFKPSVAAPADSARNRRRVTLLVISGISSSWGTLRSQRAVCASRLRRSL